MEHTLKVTAVLYPVAQELHAKPGDRVMVVAGVVVGVYTGQGEAHGVPIHSESKPDLPHRRPLLNPEPKPAKPKSARPLKLDQTSAAVQARREQVLNYINTTTQPRTVSEVAMMLFGSTSKHEKNRAYNYLKTLFDNGKIDCEMKRDADGQGNVAHFSRVPAVREVANG